LALDDADLVRRTLRGDRETFADLYDRYARLVRAFCWDATRDLPQAQDLTQEVFLRAFQRLPELWWGSRYSTRWNAGHLSQDNPSPPAPLPQGERGENMRPVRVPLTDATRLSSTLRLATRLSSPKSEVQRAGRGIN
jgi:hypothetical protein